MWHECTVLGESLIVFPDKREGEVPIGPIRACLLVPYQSLQSKLPSLHADIKEACPDYEVTL